MSRRPVFFLVEKESATDDSQRDNIFKKLAVGMRPKPLNSKIQIIYYAFSNFEIRQEMSSGDPKEL